MISNSSETIERGWQMTSGVTHQVVRYNGWDDCHRLSNGIAELIVSSTFGPRVLRFALAGGDNVFLEQYDEARGTPDSEFKLYGGHRLWHSPEDPRRTYVPDNIPVEVAYVDGVLNVVQAAEPVAMVEKTLELALDPTGARAIVTHTLTNRGAWPVELAVWALSVMAPGGTAVLPLPPRSPHGPDNLLPTNSFICWSYTDFSDPRWSFAPRALMLYGDPGTKDAQKVGAPVQDGWLAYWRDGTAFIKQTDFDARAGYPDGGASVELFTNGLFLELETLGPIVRLAPGKRAEHIESWALTRDLPAPSRETIDSYFEWAGGEQ
jgi:hypothetical protein